jgi:hypothetical protein
LRLVEGHTPTLVDKSLLSEVPDLNCEETHTTSVYTNNLGFMHFLSFIKKNSDIKKQKYWISFHDLPHLNLTIAEILLTLALNTNQSIWPILVNYRYLKISVMIFIVAADLSFNGWSHQPFLVQFGLVSTIWLHY